MKKISLVELSQLEVKPNKIRCNGLIYEYGKENNEYSYYDGGHIIKFINEEIPFSKINEPLIEIVEEPLLTDEEREFLKMCILFSPLTRIEKIYVEKLVAQNKIVFEQKELESSILVHKNHFNKMNHFLYYELKDLGLEEMYPKWNL